jgi:uncharacterized protein (TIGR02147 family)
LESVYCYREILKGKFEEKKAKNPQFSLRSFARVLDLSPSHISKILNGKGKLSLSKADQVSNKLKFTEEERKKFFRLVMYDHAYSDEVKIHQLNKLKQGNISFKEIDLENFKVISEWYHFAILSLSRTKGFVAEPEWISNRLGINLKEADSALSRLHKLGILIKDENGIHAYNDSQITTTNDISSLAIRENHKQTIKKGLQAIDSQPVNEREFHSVVLSVANHDIPRAKKLIRNIIDNINEEFDVPNGDEVYQLNMQFFRLTEKE